MAELLLLGTGASLADGSREPTMLAVRGAASTIVIDCGTNPIRQLQRLGVPLASIDRLILTHSHPDHTSGFPLLVEMLWLAGRQQLLPIHAPPDTLDLVQRVWAQWDTRKWTGLFELDWRAVPLVTSALVVDTPEFEVRAAPGAHSVPVMGLRIRDKQGGGLLAYSADGGPSPGILSLAQRVDLLVHEATGNYPSHSSAEAAGRLARQANARRLVLVHLAPLANDLVVQRREAAEAFGAEVTIGEDLARFDF